MNLQQRREVEFEKYRKAYRDYPRYGNRDVRVGLVREWLVSHLEDGPEPTEEFLDVGCGRGEVLEVAFDLALDVRGCDVVGRLVDEWVSYRQLDRGAAELPYRDRSFDLVTCTDVLEHCLEEDIPAILRELKRVARGPILLCVCHIEDRPGKYGPDQLHITVHPREWWLDMIDEHMQAPRVKVLYDDRTNSNGTWVEVNCT